MPELPEIEVIARQLRKEIVGKSIAEVSLSGFSLRKPVEPSFSPCLQGRTIQRIHRRGKYLIAEMEPRAFWLIHLGMTGRLTCCLPGQGTEKHTHAVIRFSDARELRYSDHRRFGLLAVYPVTRLSQIPELGRLGKDPFNFGFHEQWLRLELQKSRLQIKSFLLDQSKIAGLGNIYACEALFQARIHPARRTRTMTRKEVRRLIRAIRSVLRAGIRHRGTTFSDYIDAEGQQGDNQTFLRVFQKAGQKCTRCPAKIRRLRQGNRSSFYCPRCQV